jgi:hypothetical protein
VRINLLVVLALRKPIRYNGARFVGLSLVNAATTLAVTPGTTDVIIRRVDRGIK